MAKTNTIEKVGKTLDEANVWYKRLLFVGGAIATICGAVVGAAAYINSQLDGRISGQVQEVSDKIDNIDQELNRVRMDTLRLQLFFYIRHNPQEHYTILEIARVYFVDYGGDWIATDEFKKWAAQENVEIPFELKH